MTLYDRDALLASVDLRALADELLGGHHGSERSPTWPCPLPTHAQTGRTPPVSIFVTRWGEQRWRCHGCGASGSAIDLVIHTHGVDVRRAMDLLASRTGISSDEPSRTGPQRRRPNAIERSEPHPGVEDYVAICEDYLWTPAADGPARYLTETRRLSEEVLRLNRVGFDPGPRHLDRPDGVPRSIGIVLPVLDDEGWAVFSQTRRLGRIKGPRYLNCAGRVAPNPRLARYRTGQRDATSVVVCEGAIDALTAADAGCRSVAILGSTVADDRVADQIAALGSSVVISFDADDAGDRGAAGLACLLRTRGMNVARLRPPEAAVDMNGWAHALGEERSEVIRQSVERAVARSSCRAPPAIHR